MPIIRQELPKLNEVQTSMGQKRVVVPLFDENPVGVVRVTLRPYTLDFLFTQHPSVQARTVSGEIIVTKVVPKPGDEFILPSVVMHETHEIILARRGVKRDKGHHESNDHLYRAARRRGILRQVHDALEKVFSPISNGGYGVGESDVSRKYRHHLFKTMTNE